MADVRLRKYGVQTTIDFDVYGIDGVDLNGDWVPAAADCEIMKDGGASTQCDNTATDEGITFSIVLTATEMEAARPVLKIQDAVTKVILDEVIIIETYGNAAAQHAFDLDTASQVVASVAGNVDGNVSGTVTVGAINDIDFSATMKTSLDTACDTVTVTAIGANVITAASVANAAIDNATFAADVGSTAYATNIIALAVRKVLDEIKLDHLVAVADADDVVNDSIIAKLADSTATADWSSYVNTTDSLRANRDRGDSAWTTATTVTTVTGNVNGSVGSVAGNVDGNVGGNITGTLGGMTAAALKDMFDTDSTTTYASAVSGSVVKEIADNASGGSTNNISIKDTGISIT